MLAQALGIVKREAYEALLIPDGEDNYRVSTPFGEYLTRPETYSSISYYGWQFRKSPHVIVDIIGQLPPDIDADGSDKQILPPPIVSSAFESWLFI